MPGYSDPFKKLTIIYWVSQTIHGVFLHLYFNVMNISYCISYEFDRLKNLFYNLIFIFSCYTMLLWFDFFETQSHYVTQVGLELSSSMSVSWTLRSHVDTMLPHQLTFSFSTTNTYFFAFFSQNLLGTQHRKFLLNKTVTSNWGLNQCVLFVL